MANVILINYYYSILTVGTIANNNLYKNIKIIIYRNAQTVQYEYTHNN